MTACVEHNRFQDLLFIGKPSTLQVAKHFGLAFVNDVMRFGLHKTAA